MLTLKGLHQFGSGRNSKQTNQNYTCQCLAARCSGISHHYKPVVEKQIRSTLVETYRRLSETGESFRTLADQKLKDETSFFHMTLFRKVEEVRGVGLIRCFFFFPMFPCFFFSVFFPLPEFLNCSRMVLQPAPFDGFESYFVSAPCR